MPTPSCALCEIPLTPENDSREHVIPNAIGGRKKITGFICVACNTGKGGADWDAELARQLNPICLQLGITRGRGDVPAQAFETTDGDHYVREPDGKLRLTKPNFERTQDGNGEQIKITARSMSEVRRIVNG
ncbi:MAG: HNH endonuclease, partial [Opitutaceae bacterium]